MLPSVTYELYMKNSEVSSYGACNKGLFRIRIDRGQKGLNIYLNRFSNISVNL